MNAMNNDKIPWEKVFDYATEDISMYLWSLESWIDPPDGYDQEYLLLLILNSRARSRFAISLIKNDIPSEYHKNRDKLNGLWQKAENRFFDFVETNQKDIVKIIVNGFPQRLLQLEQDLKKVKKIAKDGDLMVDPTLILDDLNEHGQDFILEFQSMANSIEEIQSIKILKDSKIEKFIDNFKQVESLFKDYFGYFNPISDFLTIIGEREYGKNQWWLTRYPEFDDVKEDEIPEIFLESLRTVWQKEGQKLQIDCPQSDTAVAYAFDELSDIETKSFRDHMLGCRFCFDLVQDIQLSEIESKEKENKHVEVLPALEKFFKNQKEESTWELFIKSIRNLIEQMSIPKIAVSLVTAGIAAIIISYGIYTSGPAKFNVNLKITAETQIRAGSNELKEFTLKNGGELDSKDKFRIIANIDKNAFVYVIYKDSSGKIDLLKREANTAVNSLTLPSEDTWYVLDSQTGDEAIYLIASKQKIEDIETRLDELRKIGIDNINQVFKKAKIETFKFKHN